MKPALIKIEVERIVNLVAGFGWIKAEEKISEGEVQLILKKTLPVTTED